MNCSHDEAASRHSESQRRTPDSAFLIFDHHKISPSAPIGVKAREAIAVVNSGLAKVRRVVLRLNANPAERPCAEPPVQKRGDKERGAHEKSADAADRRKDAAVCRIIQFSLSAGRQDQQPDDRETHSLADQAQPGRDSGFGTLILERS